MIIKTICRYCLKLFTDDELHIKKDGQASNACLTCWNKYYKMKHNDPNICGNCRIHCQDGFGIRPNGKAYKSCLRCRENALKNHEKYRCPHGREKYKCRYCKGSQICEHDRLRYRCRECGGVSICEHDRRRNTCRECGGTSICEHDRQRNNCRVCNDPIKLTIKQWIIHCRHNDKKFNRFDSDHFIDTDFLKGLIEDYEKCFYQDCKVKMQYTEYGSNMATIERLDNTKGHTKSNCVLCCLECNLKKKSNKFVDNKNPN